jgi:phospholipid/cholesterol/gamma-HCH transport system ATP-binding protein
VLWDEVSVARRGEVERRAAQVAFGMIFQSDALFDSLTVLDNVLLPLRKRRVPEAEARARAIAALERVGLGHALEKRPENLSGGMKKRAGVARAIVARPAVLIADDPFAGLDPVTEQSIADLLMEVSEGRTLIVALPDPVASLPVERAVKLVGGVTA